MAVSIGITIILFSLFNRAFTWADIGIGAGITLTLFAIAFPLFYLLKPGHIGTAIVIGFVLVFILSQVTMTFLEKHLTSIVQFLSSASTPSLYISVAGIIIVLYAASWLISQMIYQRKAF